MIPTGLIPKRGMVENSSRTTNRRMAHRTHVPAIPRATPAGMAVLHQFRASSRTNRRSCWRLMPMQRSIPKNLVRWATVLLMLPEIISTPAIRMRRNSAPAARRRVWPIEVSSMARKDRFWPCFSASRLCSMRTAISAMLKIAVTRKTAKMMQRRVMRFCRRRTLAEMGMRLR